MYKYERIERNCNFICVRDFKFGKGRKSFFKRIYGKFKNGRNINAIKFLVICLILTAAMVVISIAISIADKGDNAIGLSDYDNFIWPVVMQNAENFNENSPPEIGTMVASSVWKVAMDKKDNKNSFNKNQELVLSLKEVREACNDLFGKDFDRVDLIGINDDFFEFDSKNNQFLVKSISGVDNYVPHTVNAYRRGEDIILKVGYVIPSDQFEINMNEIFDNKIVKYKNYRLKINQATGKKYIAAVE